MADIVLSACAKAFINFLTSRVRQQLKQLLYMYKQLLEIEITKLKMMLASMDITRNLYIDISGKLNDILRPLESLLASIPFEEFKSCPEVANTLGNFHAVYFDKKNEYLGLAYKKAQYTFASTYYSDYLKQLENSLDKISVMINYINALASLSLTVNTPVKVFTYNKDAQGNKYPITRTGKYQSTTLNTAYITMDDTNQTEAFNLLDDVTIQT